MPLGFERINARRKQPNERINFIKPLEGPDMESSQDFLERLAAIVNPIMKKHHIYVMALEEYEPNPEFLGRNFNFGEVIQLVLKTRSGQWHSFRFVQMVLIHELSHCKQMNHSKAFWKLRNEYAEEMKALWTKGYSGEGLWSRGVILENGRFADNSLNLSEPPEHLCGGTYRSSRGSKRKRKPKVSHKKREAKRIAKKFGVHGQTLGADDLVKVELEKGVKINGKPRVAGSARGRELRAAAALARFNPVKEEPISSEPDEDMGSETEDDNEPEVSIKTEAAEAIDINGKKLLDSSGNGYHKVCSDDDEESGPTNDEMSQILKDLSGVEDSDIISRDTGRYADVPESRKSKVKHPTAVNARHFHTKGQSTIIDGTNDCFERSAIPATLICEACSVENEPKSSLCAVCANVLDASQVPNTWYCKSATCRDAVYVNAGDAGICGVCGERRGTSSTTV